MKKHKICVEFGRDKTFVFFVLATGHLNIRRRKNYAENDYKEIIEEKKRYTLEKYIKVSTGILKKLKSIILTKKIIYGDEQK